PWHGGAGLNGVAESGAGHPVGVHARPPAGTAVRADLPCLVHGHRRAVDLLRAPADLLHRDQPGRHAEGDADHRPVGADRAARGARGRCPRPGGLPVPPGPCPGKPEGPRCGARPRAGGLMKWGLRDVDAARGRDLVLTGVTVPVDPSCVTVVVGGDGAGKSTCLEVLVGLLAVRSGTVLRPPKERIGYVPATAGLYADLTVQENLDFS